MILGIGHGIPSIGHVIPGIGHVILGIDHVILGIGHVISGATINCSNFIKSKFPEVWNTNHVDYSSLSSDILLADWAVW